MSQKSLPVVLSDAEFIRLEQWIRAGSTPQQVVLRARIILSGAEGHSAKASAQLLGVHRRTVALWRRRACAQGIGCVWGIAPGRGRKPRYDAARVGQWVEATLQTKPAGSTHWSTRSLARVQGVSKNTIQRAWQDHGLKPHLTKSFKLSRDPKFLEKLTDVVGVYLTPPQNAIVLCVDEKSQIQALDRTQPGLPLKPGRCGTYTHDYVRHGTTTLFAALHVVEGQVIGECYPRHRHQEFLKFLQRLDDEFPGGKNLHLILDARPRARAALAETTSPVCAALHPHQFELAQSGRTLVCRTQPEGRAPRGLSQRARLATRHHGVPLRVERQSHALRLDRQRRTHPGKNRPGSPAPRKNRTGLHPHQTSRQSRPPHACQLNTTRFLAPLLWALICGTLH